jgi:phage tail protein X
MLCLLIVSYACVGSEAILRQHQITVAACCSADYPTTLTQASDLAALNPGMDFTQPLPAGLSICVGNFSASSWCNTPLQNEACPSTQAPLVSPGISTGLICLAISCSEAVSMSRQPAAMCAVTTVLPMLSL